MTQAEFLHEVDNWANHRIFLWLALQATDTDEVKDILELGMGWGSTPFLHQYSVDTGRPLLSIEGDGSWAEKLDRFNRPPQHRVSADWGLMFQQRWASALIDHAPGERRAPDLVALAPLATIIVIHDTEPHLAHQYDSIWPRFRYKADIAGHLNGAWATAVSTSFDVTQWKGMELGGYTII